MNPVAGNQHFRIAFTVLLCNLVFSTPAYPFDCSVIYDEFDSLMHREFLVTPDNYVPTISGELGYDDFQAIQKGRFFLRKDRPAHGIGIVFTNDKLYGKFLFHWPEPGLLTIDEIIIYNRVEDGYGPVRRGPVSIRPGETVDLDTATLFQPSGDKEDIEALRADLILTPDSILETINEARVFFPTASMCN